MDEDKQNQNPQKLSQPQSPNDDNLGENSMQKQTETSAKQEQGEKDQNQDKTQDQTSGQNQAVGQRSSTNTQLMQQGGSDNNKSANQSQNTSPANLNQPQQNSSDPQRRTPQEVQSSSPKPISNLSTSEMSDSTPQKSTPPRSQSSQNSPGQTIPPQDSASFQSQQKASTPKGGSDTQQAQQPQSSPQQADKMQGDGSQGPTSVVTTDSKKGPSKFAIIIGILIVITIIIYGGVAYIYFQNKQLEEEVSSAESQQNEAVQTQPTATPTPPFTPDQIQIENGSIIRERPNGETEVLVDKNNYESTGITGFINVTVSPDNQLMCFESWPPAPEPAMYIANIDGSNVVEVNPNRRNCEWLQDSQSIVYTNHVREASTVDVYMYDVSTDQETSLTANTQTETEIRQYATTSISDANQTIQCTYSVLDSAGEVLSEENECEIDLSTGEVTDSGSSTTTPAETAASPSPTGSTSDSDQTSPF